jgi:hypothetical protein
MDLIAETPATGILIKNNWGDAKQYIVTCECGQSDHDHAVFVESDESGITVTTYTTGKTNWWSRTRWHHIWTLLTKGYIKYECSLIMNRQQAMNYASILHHAVEDVEQFRKAK